MSAVPPPDSTQDTPFDNSKGPPKKKRNLTVQTPNLDDSSSSLQKRVSVHDLEPGKAEVAIYSTHSKKESDGFVQRIHEGLQNGKMHFEAAAQSNSAPYFIKEGHETVAIFKAAERETKSRDGINIQEGVYGELIGYQLGFEDDVPLTILVNLSLNAEGINLVHKGPLKFGSLQQWNTHAQCLLSIPEKEHYNNAIQRLAILDLRILNTDRHGNNVLFDTSTNRVIPIDHGCVCPRLVDSDPCNFIWMLNAESTKPFSAENRERIKKINPKEDRSLIEQLFVGREFPSERLDSMQLSATLLKMGAEAGLSPFELGYFFYNRLDADHEPLGTIIYKEVLQKMSTVTNPNYDSILQETIEKYLKLYKSLEITQDQLINVLSSKEESVDHILNFCRKTNERLRLPQ